MPLKKQSLQVGDKVSIDAGGKWTGKDGVTKWFTSINGYKFEKEGGQSGSVSNDLTVHPSILMTSTMMESKTMSSNLKFAYHS